MPALTSCPTGPYSSSRTTRSWASSPTFPQRHRNSSTPSGRSLTSARPAGGIRHQLPAVVLIAATAVLTGATSFAAIAQWTRHCGRTLLDTAGMTDARIPSEPTIRRIVEMLDADTFYLLIYAWMRLSFTTIGGRRVIACDGKTVRGAKDKDGNQPHLLAAMDHARGTVVGQVEVSVKTNEIPMLRELLGQFDITGSVITMDALHTQRATIEHVVSRGGHGVMTVKKNQPTLYNELKTLAVSTRGRTLRKPLPPIAVVGGGCGARSTPPKCRRGSPDSRISGRSCRFGTPAR